VPYEGEWVDLRSSVQNAVEASTCFAAELWHPVVLPQPMFDEPSTLETRCCLVLAAEEQLSRWEEKTPGVLNFASARNPGGGFTTGAEAQESIARSSAFFVSRRRARSGAYTHDVIYSPRVPEIRDAAGILLNEPYEVDFATATAPNVGSLKSQGNEHASADSSCVGALCTARRARSLGLRCLWQSAVHSGRTVQGKFADQLPRPFSSRGVCGIGPQNGRGFWIVLCSGRGVIGEDRAWHARKSSMYRDHPVV